MTATDPTIAEVAIRINVDAAGVDLTTPVGQRSVWDDDEDARISREITLGVVVAEHIAAGVMKDPRYNALRDEVLKIRTDVIREQLVPIVAAAIDGEIARTNNYGEPTGQVTTLRELIVKEVADYLKSPADKYNRERGTAVEAFITAAVDKAIKTELAGAVLAEKEKVVAAVRAKAAELIAQAVKEGIGR